MSYRIVIFASILILLSGFANAIENCKGKRVFSCSSLAKNVASKRKCYLHYQCKETLNGEECFQCEISINKLTKGLCDLNPMAKCLKKDI
jgi:hypothetical protein